MQICSEKFDVIILGSGIGGSTLATILAKHQAKVLMIDKGTHPRFAIGEALTSHTEKLFLLLSYQYDIPEFNYLSSFHKINQNLQDCGCGYKRSFSFLYHQEGEEQAPQQRIQWGTGHTSHLFRQEIDHFLVKTATKYGAKLLCETTVSDINIDKSGVVVKLAGGEEIQANYLVDASGYNSILAEKFNLREKPTRFKTHSRSIFTHLVGVKNADDCLQEAHENITPFYQGTVHHIFDGGWIWVIPFNNHENSNNPVCSVGLNLDSRRFPKKNNLSPEQEFQDFISRFPTIQQQFANAKSVRKWITTDRLQYSSSSSVGERFYILPHAAGITDALFSVGIIQTLITISPLAALILQAINIKDFTTKNFIDLAQLQQDIFDYNDKIANCTYISFRNFNLMNAWLRVWVLQHMMSVAKLTSTQVLRLALENYRGCKNRDWSRFTNIDFLKDIDPRTLGWGNNYVQKAIAEVEKVEQNLISVDEAANNIISILNSTSWLFKTCGLVNPERRFMDILTSQRFGMSFLVFSLWSQIFLKKEARPYYFTFQDFIDATRWQVEL